MVCERLLESRGVAAQDPRDVCEAETERPQTGNLRRPLHLIGTIGAPTGRRAHGQDQTALLVEPQCFDRNPKTPGGFGRTEELL
jgi:hypothetical protein